VVIGNTHDTEALLLGQTANVARDARTRSIFVGGADWSRGGDSEHRDNGTSDGGKT